MSFSHWWADGLRASQSLGCEDDTPAAVCRRETASHLVAQLKSAAFCTHAAQMQKLPRELRVPTTDASEPAYQPLGRQ